MSRLFFPIRETRELIAHAQRCDKHFKPYGRKARPAIIFVKDDGIYIMSSGLVEGEKRIVVYAEGYDPNVVSPDYLWDLCRQAAGGDDFSEAFALDGALVKDIQNPNVTRLYIDLTETSIAIGTELLPHPTKFGECPACQAEVAFKPLVARGSNNIERVVYRSPVLCPFCKKSLVHAEPKKRRARGKSLASTEVPRIHTTP